MIVAVGSTNPTKTGPVKEVFIRYFSTVDVVGIKVPSGVSEQPVSLEETYRGALNRARKSLHHVKKAVYGVGIEGGLQKYTYGWFEQSLVVIIDRKGSIGIGASGGLILPEKIMTRIQSGMNLEEAIDEIFGTSEIGKGIGMFGILTKGLVTRSEGVKHGVAFALARFLHDDLYS